MSVIFMEGFEHPFFAVNEQITGWTTNGSGLAATQEDDAEFGKRLRLRTTENIGVGVQVNVHRRYYRKVGDSWGNYFVMGFRVRVTQQGGRVGAIYKLTETGNMGAAIIEFGTDTSGICTINGEPVDSGMLMEVNVDHFLELEIDKVASVCRAWLNNQLVGSAPLDPDISAIGYWLGFIGEVWVGSLEMHVADLDDHYAADGNGSINRSRLGRVKVVMRLPQADQVAEFNRLGGDSNASQVNDLTNPVTDSTYVYSNAEGAVDLYTNSDELPFPSAPVLAVAVSVSGRKEGPDARAVAPTIRSGLADEVGERVNLFVTSVAGGTSVFNLNPATSEAWTRETAEDASFGHTLVV